MGIPHPATASRDGWSSLDQTEKRRRLLEGAAEVFARDGLDAPMPAIAAAAGAGVGSVYRQFASKDELLAALVVERLSVIGEDSQSALERPGTAWTSLVDLLWSLAERQAEDHVMGEAMASVSEHPAVQVAHASTLQALGRVLDAAREEGTLRADVTTLDLQLLFAGTRAAAQFGPDAWRRVLELGISALAASAQSLKGAETPISWPAASRASTSRRL
jgi:AcrR family transcriptional regulator